jgi:hypothetical protein
VLGAEVNREERARNRELMPESAAVIDEFTRVFGRPQWFRFRENGHFVEYGEPSDPAIPQEDF